MNKSTSRISRSASPHHQAAAQGGESASGPKAHSRIVSRAAPPMGFSFPHLPVFPVEFSPLADRLGVPLSEVTLRSDAATAKRAGELGARAFTNGREIGLGADRETHSAVDQTARQHTLAHELTHVAQARGGGADLLLDTPRLRIGVGRGPHPSPFDAPALVDAEAESTAAAVLRGSRPMIAARSFAGLALQSPRSESAAAELQRLPLVESVSRSGGVTTYYFNIAALRQRGGSANLPLLGVEQYIRDTYPGASGAVVAQCVASLQVHWLTKPIALDDVPEHIKRVWVGISQGTEAEVSRWFAAHHPELKPAGAPAVQSGVGTAPQAAPGTPGMQISARTRDRISQGPDSNPINVGNALKAAAVTAGKGLLVAGAIGVLLGAEVLTLGQVNWLLLGIAGAAAVKAFQHRRDEARRQHVDVPLVDSAIHAIGDVVGASPVVEGAVGREFGTNRVLGSEERTERVGVGAGSLTTAGLALPAVRAGQSVGARALELRIPRTDMYHGTSSGNAASVRRGIRLDINDASPGRQQWGPGFYLGREVEIATYYASQTPSPTVLSYLKVPLERLGTILDVTVGEGARLWAAHLDKPVFPGHSMRNRQVWEAQDARGGVFHVFLKENNLNPDVVVAPHGTPDGKQIIIRSASAAERLQGFLAGE